MSYKLSADGLWKGFMTMFSLFPLYMLGRGKGTFKSDGGATDP